MIVLDFWSRLSTNVMYLSTVNVLDSPPAKVDDFIKQYNIRNIISTQKVSDNPTFHKSKSIKT